MKSVLKFKHFHPRRMCLKMLSAKWRPFCPSFNVLTELLIFGQLVVFFPLWLYLEGFGDLYNPYFQGCFSGTGAITCLPQCQGSYRKVSNIRHTQSQNLNDFHLVLQSSLPNPLKPGAKSRMKMQLEQRRQAMLQIHLSDQQFNCPLSAPYIRNLTVLWKTG